eukprot:XP_016885611.1 uncharacterized protein LOC107987386 [Homo sapiens]
MWDLNSASPLTLAVSLTQACARTPPRWRSRPLSSVLSSVLLAGKFLLAQTLFLGPAWWGKRKGQCGEVAEGLGPGWSAERQAAVRSREPRTHPPSPTGPAGVGEALGTAASSRGPRREHGARNWRARLAGGTVRSRRTRPGPRGYGAVAAAGAGAHPRANHRKELKAAGARVAAGVGAGFSGFARPAAPCQEEEETPRACDTVARLAAGSTHVTDEETKEHSYLLTRTRAFPEEIFFLVERLRTRGAQ